MRDRIGTQAERFLDHLLVERGLSGNTIGAYRRDLDRYVDYLRTREIADARKVTEKDVT
ncbi:MAG: site-specific integrase, partial [Actinomycetota bacterium]